MKTFTYTVTLEHIAPAYAGEHTFTVKQESGGYFAKAKLYGCGKTYSTPENAIHCLALDNGATVLEIVQHVEEDNSGHFEFNWEWINANGECEGICQQWIYADNFAQACEQFESFHGPIGKDEFGIETRITLVRFEKYLPL